MDDLYSRVEESAAFLRDRGLPRPSLVIVLGSGLDGLASRLEAAGSLPFGAVPRFASSTVDFHAGTLHWGRLAGLPVTVLEGRLHYYEGHSMAEVVHPLRALRALGAEGVVLCSAVGGLAPSLAVSMPADEPGFPLNPPYTFDTYVVGPNNEMACAACSGVAWCLS